MTKLSGACALEVASDAAPYARDHALDSQIVGTVPCRTSRKRLSFDEQREADESGDSDAGGIDTCQGFVRACGSAQTLFALSDSL